VIGLSNVLLGLAVVSGATDWARRRRQLPRGPIRLAGLYLLLLLAATAASRDPMASLRSASEIFSFATFALALLCVRGERAARWLVDALILMGAVVATWGLGQLVFEVGGVELESRIRGPYSHYMTLAGVLVLVAMLLIARMLRREADPEARGHTRWLDRPWFSGLVLALVTGALLVTLTRSAWLALIASLLVVAGLERPRLLAGLVPVGVAFLVLAPTPIVARALSIGDLSDTSNYDRLCMAEAGLSMIGERPLLGVGPAMVKRIYPLYRHPTAPRLSVPHLHDAYLQLAAERGLPALGVLLALFASALLAARRGYRAGGAAADLHLGVIGALLAFAVAALFENNWGDTEVQRVVLFLLALPFGIVPREPEPE